MEYKTTRKFTKYKKEYNRSETKPLSEKKKNFNLYFIIKQKINRNKCIPLNGNDEIYK